MRAPASQRSALETRNLSGLIETWDFLYRAVAYSICHPGHLVQRMLTDNPFPLCYRETGIFVGFLASFAILAVTHRDKPGGLPPARILAVMGALVAAMGVDGLTSYAGFWSGSNQTRLLTGLMTGFALSALVFPLFNGQLLRHSSDDEVLGTPGKALAWLAGIPVAYLLIWMHPFYLGYLMPHLAIGAVVGLVVMINMLAVSSLPPLERAIERWWQLALLAAPSLAVAAVEFGFFFTFHRFMHTG